MAETLQQMILRKKKEREAGAMPKPAGTGDNAAALKNLQTEVSTAKADTEVYFDRTKGKFVRRGTVDMQSEETKKQDTGERSVGQKLLEERRKRAKAKEYVEKK